MLSDVYALLYRVILQRIDLRVYKQLSCC